MESILQELDIKHELAYLDSAVGQVRKRKLSYFGHLCRALSCKFVCTSVAFYLKRVPAALCSVNLIKFTRALSRI